MSSGSEFQTTTPETRKLLGPKRRVLVRSSQVISNSRSQVSPGADLSDRIAGAAEVCRTLTMEGVVDEDCDLEFDTLTDGKPVELISQHRSDMFELPPVRDQPGCGIEDGLPHQNRPLKRRILAGYQILVFLLYFLTTTLNEF